MVIEHADRFGLAQLHQLRGRVGRGSDAAYCLLVTEKLSPQAQERLNVFAATHDGFVIAEHDLRLRGPGEFLGTRQSGLPDLVLADLRHDGEWLEKARASAQKLLNTDPDLSAPEHSALKAELFRFFRKNLSVLEG
jgi:ATP-dependent DNA helicase RecG